MWLLGVLLTACVLVLAVVLFVPGGHLTGTDRLLTTFFMLLLAVPLAMQLRASRGQNREMRGNRIELTERGVEFQLAGSSRERKGLPAVNQTCLEWGEIRGVTRRRQTFVYPSLIPFAYRLDVFTVQTGGSECVFTGECIRGAKRIALEIAARAGVGVHDL